MKTRVLVTGAAGMVGEPTVRELLRRGDRYEVVAFDIPSRAARRRLRPYRHHARIVFGDIREPHAVARALEGVSAVIHLAAIIPPRADRQPELTATVNAGGTRNLIDVAERTGRPIRLVHASSIAIYGDRLADPWISVGDPLCPSPHDQYAETKIQAEEHVRSSGLPWTIFRLSGVMSPRLGMDPLMFHMPLETCFEIVTERDTAYALVQTLETDGLEGRTFNLGGGPRCRSTFREYLDRHMSVMGLGEGFFPDEAFARGNFHCGYYRDSEEADDLLGFQREGLDEWMQRVRESQHRLIPVLARVFRPVARRVLCHLSEPLCARRRGDPELIERFCLDSAHPTLTSEIANARRIPS